MDFTSKYIGEQVEGMLDAVNEVMPNKLCSQKYVDEAISNAITNTLNTEV